MAHKLYLEEIRTRFNKTVGVSDDIIIMLGISMLQQSVDMVVEEIGVTVASAQVSPIHATHVVVGLVTNTIATLMDYPI